MLSLLKVFISCIIKVFSLIFYFIILTISSYVRFYRTIKPLQIFYFIKQSGNGSAIYHKHRCHYLIQTFSEGKLATSPRVLNIQFKKPSKISDSSHIFHLGFQSLTVSVLCSRLQETWNETKQAAFRFLCQLSANIKSSVLQGAQGKQFIKSGGCPQSTNMGWFNAPDRKCRSTATNRHLIGILLNISQIKLSDVKNAADLCFKA